VPRLIVTRPAVDGLERCRRFLEEIDDALAARAAETISRHLNRLTTAPEAGRRVPDSPHLQELVVPFGRSGYVALYRHDGAQDVVYILAFRHQREAGY
jgi:plasmid stabilization system protein ParE